jgi:hypothetical protein
MRPGLIAAATGVMLIAAPRVAQAANPQSGGWRADERVLVTDFSVVTALARTPEGLHAATAGGLLTLDDTFGGWGLPLTVEDGYPAALVTALVYDPRDGTLWMAAGGDLVQLDPFGRRFRDRIRVGRPVERLVPAEAASQDLFLRVGAEWWRMDTFGRDLRRADPGAVQAAIESRPDLRAREAALRDPFFEEGIERVARDWDGRYLRITDVMPGRLAQAWWLSTAGGFLFDYDHGGRDGERQVFGPVGAGMAFVEVTDDVVWFAPRSRVEGRYGIAAASHDLQTWRVWRADSAYSAPDLIRAVHGVPGGVWAGGESGLHWLAHGAAEWHEEWGLEGSALPVLSIAPAPGLSGDGVWVGTARGLYRVPAPGAGPDVSVMRSERVSFVVQADRTVWIGTARGLFAISALDSTASSRVAGRVSGPSALRSPVGGLAASGDTIYVGLDRDVWWRPGRSADWSRLDAVGQQRGVVTALAVADGVLWVGSSAELTGWEVEGGGVRRYAFGRDLPPDALGATGIWQIAPVSRRELWLAIPAGALRLETRF